MKPTEYQSVTTLADDDLILASTPANKIKTIKKSDLETQIGGGGDQPFNADDGINITGCDLGVTEFYEDITKKIIHFKDSEFVSGWDVAYIGIGGNTEEKYALNVNGLKIFDKFMSFRTNSVVTERIILDGLVRPNGAGAVTLFSGNNYLLYDEDMQIYKTHYVLRVFGKHYVGAGQYIHFEGSLGLRDVFDSARTLYYPTETYGILNICDVETHDDDTTLNVIISGLDTSDMIYYVGLQKVYMED